MGAATRLRTGDDVQVDEAGLRAGGVTGCAHVLPRHVTAQVAQLQGARLLIWNSSEHGGHTCTLNQTADASIPLTHWTSDRITLST